MTARRAAPPARALHPLTTALAHRPSLLLTGLRAVTARALARVRAWSGCSSCVAGAAAGFANSGST